MLISKITDRLDFNVFGDRAIRQSDGSMIIDATNADQPIIAGVVNMLKSIDREELIARDEGRMKLEKAGVNVAVTSRDRPADDLGPDFADLWLLYTTIKERRPVNLVEFGSGWSTYVIASAIHENGIGRLVSFDTSKKWAEVTRSTLSGGLAEVCEVVHVASREIEFEGELAFQHDIPPQAQVDFIYLDGPPLTAERSIAVDPLILENNLSADAMIVVDGRPWNVDFLKRKLRQKYKVESDILFVLTVDGEKLLAANYMTAFAKCG